MNLTAPYRFVPLNKHVFIPHFVPGYPENISQDIPFQEGEDGKIEVTFKNITPILVGGYSADGKKAPQEINHNGKSYYIIPGSSWKGMVRSVMEIMSFAKFQIYDDAYFGYRDIGQKQKGSNTNYSEQMQDILCGWLYKNDEKSYYIIPCGKADDHKLPIDKLNSDFYPSYRSIKGKDILGKLEAVNKTKDIRKWEYPKLKDDVYLVFTGDINNKRHEYGFESPDSLDDKIGIQIDYAIIKQFFSVYHNSPYNNEKNGHFIEKWLDYGKKLPVFYKGSSNSITHMGFTKMYRLAYNHHVSDGVKQEMESGRDLVECIFGYTDTDNKSSLKGRVQFGHTLVEKTSAKELLVKGVLAQPQASYYPFYLKQGKNEIQDYNANGIEIAGYKRYAVHENSSVETLPQGNGNENTMSNLHLIPAGQELSFTIHFHNLLPQELGALLSAISFHETKNIYHNIGMAKGYGYGKLELTAMTISTIDCTPMDEHAFMSRYEATMDAFTNDKYHCTWSNMPQIKSLLGIASGTIPSADLRMMELNEYGIGKDRKQNTTPQNLSSPTTLKLHSLKNADDVYFESHKVTALNFEANKQWEDAKSEWQLITTKCQNKQYINSAQQQIQRVENNISLLKEQLKEAQELEAKGLWREAILAYSLYQSNSSSSQLAKITELEDKIKEQEQNRIKQIQKDAENLERSGQYAEAIEQYREYEQASGIHQTESINRCQKMLELGSSSIDSVLSMTSVGAFSGSIKKYLKSRQHTDLTQDEIELIKQKLQGLSDKDRKVWTKDWAKKFNGILPPAQSQELLNYIK